MGWTDTLLAGLAQLLADAAIGAWRPDGTPYAETDTAITIGLLPQTPDRAVALAAYPVTDHPVLNDVTVGVQARIRGAAAGDTRPASALADAIYETLHGRRALQLGGIDIVQITRQSGAQLGPDQLGRDERTENYYIQAARPTAGRLD
jgi:hypothetical protein